MFKFYRNTSPHMGGLRLVRTEDAALCCRASSPRCSSRGAQQLQQKHLQQQQQAAAVVGVLALPAVFVATLYHDSWVYGRYYTRGALQEWQVLGTQGAGGHDDVCDVCQCVLHRCIYDIGMYLLHIGVRIGRRADSAAGGWWP